MDSPGISHTETPGLPVCVEGVTDEDFISELNRQTSDLTLNIRDCGGKKGVLESMVVLADVQIKRFCAFLDIDDSSPGDILQQVENKLEGNFDDVERPDTNIFHVDGYSQIHVGCIGLYENDTLREYGVTRHAMEDHALNLLLTDEDIVPRLSDTSIDTLDQFKGALNEQKLSIEDHIGEVDKSKILLKLSIVLLGYDGDNNTFIKNVLRCTENDLKDHSSTKEVVKIINM